MGKHLKRKPSVINRMRFGKDDPMRYLHVPQDKRLDEDEGVGANAVDEQTGDDTDFDRDKIRDSEVVPPEDLA